MFNWFEQFKSRNFYDRRWVQLIWTIQKGKHLWSPQNLIWTIEKLCYPWHLNPLVDLSRWKIARPLILCWSRPQDGEAQYITSICEIGTLTFFFEKGIALLVSVSLESWFSILEGNFKVTCFVIERRNLWSRRFQLRFTQKNIHRTLCGLKEISVLAALFSEIWFYLSNRKMFESISTMSQSRLQGYEFWRLEGLLPNKMQYTLITSKNL